MTRIRFLLAGIVLLMCCTGAAAQNGFYTVTNREGLKAEGLERLERSMLLDATVVEGGEEHSGMMPEGVDTTELRIVLSEWLSE